MEELVPSKKSRFTVEEYLRMEEAAASKHEFRDGRIIDMAGGTFNHALIPSNLLMGIRSRLKDKNCKAVGSDMQARITGKPHYCYPDVTVVCETPEFDSPTKLSLTNPQVIVEVTSPSSAEDDRSDKFYDYMRIESLQEYILVAQDRMRVDTFYRQSDGIWAIGPSLGAADAGVTFRSLGVTIPMAEIYAGIDLPAPQVAHGE